MQSRLSILAMSVLAAALVGGAAVHHASASSQDKLLVLAQAGASGANKDDKTKTKTAPTTTKTAPTAKKTAPAASKKKVTGTNNATGAASGGKKASALTTSDCGHVGGTVVTVTDGRCGASGQYCRMPDSNAVCIDKKD